MADIFGRTEQEIKVPITADKAIINWGGVVTGALSISISYQQPVTKRRTIGNNAAVIYAGQPSGQIQIQRLLTSDINSLFSAPGWKGCEPGTLTLSLGAGCNLGGDLNFTAHGCIVTSFSVQAEAEGLTVVDSVSIDFLQLFSNAVTGTVDAVGNAVA